MKTTKLLCVAAARSYVVYGKISIAEDPKMSTLDIGLL
ncbi:uncharacterized protein RAG0_15201 [Rhynchosporium agropyri]|uniref:Uncharacterized protein n=1 Tax=Rhynchosporium agropyri TaxID=914238 RepID=A0A1E1LK39_9HELO|nr:uncharacterized protein RAG0_15201 [Rhynchosporium agropyri]